MIAAIVMTVIQILYWFLVVVESALNLIPLSVEQMNTLPPFFLHPFSALVSLFPNGYIVFQCLFMLMSCTNALWILISKRFSKKVKVCGGLNLLFLTTVFYVPFALTACFNFSISIILLCLVAVNRKQSNMKEVL